MNATRLDYVLSLTEYTRFLVADATRGGLIDDALHPCSDMLTAGRHGHALSK